MPTLTKYILKRCVFIMACTILAMGFVLILPHIGPLIRLLNIGQVSWAEFWTMVFLLYPMIFYLQMPLIVAFSIGFVYLFLARDKELIVAMASGASPLRIAMPGLVTGLIGALICALLSLYLLPVAMLQLKELIYVSSKRLNPRALAYGEFNYLGGGITLYFRDINRSGQMKGVIIKKENIEKDLQFITAKRGDFEFGKVFTSILLYDGVIQESRKETKEASFVDFTFFRYRIGETASYKYPVGRPWGYYERHIGELLHPPPNVSLTQQQRAEWTMEAHKRIINPVLCIVYGILIVGFISWASTRIRSIYSAIPLSFVGILGVHGFYTIFLSAYVKVSADAPVILYGTPAFVLINALLYQYLLMRRRKGKFLRPS